MRYLILLVFLLAPGWVLSDVSKLSLEARKIKTLRHPYYPLKDDWRGYMGLNWEYTKGWLFHDNRVFYYGDKSQVFSIGWEFEIGYTSKYFDIYWHHLSEHVADHNREDIQHVAKFPLEDSIGFRLNLLQ